MNEDTKITFFLEDLRSKDLLHEETRTLKEWTGLTEEAMKDWSVLHLDRILEQVRKDWARTQVLGGWKIAEDTSHHE